MQNKFMPTRSNIAISQAFDNAICPVSTLKISKNTRSVLQKRTKQSVHK
jgi:hypothetical protein